MDGRVQETSSRQTAIFVRVSSTGRRRRRRWTIASFVRKRVVPSSIFYAESLIIF